VTAIDLPSGAALDPFVNPTFEDGGTNPNAATPSGLAVAGGALWVALGNLHPDYSPAGNSFLAEIDPATGTVTGAYALGLEDGGLGCVNASAVAAHGTSVVVACTGDYVSGGAVVFDTATHAITHRLALGGGPGVIAVVGDTAYFGDSARHGVTVADLANGAVTVDAAHEAPVCTDGTYDYVSGLAAGPSAADVLATCFDSAAGSLQHLSPSTGAPIAGAGVDTLAGPSGIVYLGTTASVDTYAVLDAFAPAVQLAPWPSGGAAFTGSIALPDGMGWSDLAASSGALFVAGGAGDSVTRIDLATSAVTGSAALPAGSDPFRIVATDAHTVWTTLSGTGQVAKVRVP